jgi:hypothetical protein
MVKILKTTKHKRTVNETTPNINET